jgi:hypothetical protein
MKTKVIVLAVMLSLVTAPAYARGHNVSHSNPYKYFKHTRMIKSYRGHVTIYNP